MPDPVQDTLVLSVNKFTETLAIFIYDFPTNYRINMKSGGNTQTGFQKYPLIQLRSTFFVPTALGAGCAVVTAVKMPAQLLLGRNKAQMAVLPRSL